MPRDHQHNPDPNANAARIVTEATAAQPSAKRWWLGSAIASWTVAILWGAQSMSALASEPASPAVPVGQVTLLVPGMAFHPALPTHIWGRHSADGWTGMIGHLEESGFRFGGVLRAADNDFTPPAALDATGANGDPKTATLFALDFTRAADTDGVAFKALELAAAIESLRRFTGAERINLVAHSAGGVVARAYLQNALPGVPYRGDVARLITIGTPHLGSATASRVGSLMGIRATSISVDAPLIEQLNQKLSLPTDVCFAAIVIRGIGADTRGSAVSYRPHLDAEFLERLPEDYRRGGDQMVHVITQNLALAKVSRRYEEQTGRPVQYLLVRVPDPSPRDLTPLGRRVHSEAPWNGEVAELVDALLKDQGSYWTGLDEESWKRSAERHARLCAASAIESESLEEHPASEVRAVMVNQLDSTGGEGAARSYRFSGSAETDGRILRRSSYRVTTSGTLEVECDRFGRVVRCEHHVEDTDDERIP